MLERLTIENFQAHRHLSVALDPGITTLVGPSDVGKSAILRALRWVAQNKPDGDAFIRDGEKSVSVTLNVDGHSIRRSRGVKNLYEVDGNILEAFGREVPQDVATILNTSTVNFQGQHDAAFWLSESPAEVARQLNSIVDLGAIDTAFGNISSWIRKARTELEVYTERKEKAFTEAKGLEWITEMHPEAKALTRMEQDHQATTAQVENCSRLVVEVERHTSALIRGELYIADLSAVVKLAEKKASLNANRDKLTGLANQYCVHIGKVNLPIPDLSTVLMLVDEAKGLARRVSSLKSTLNTARTAYKAIGDVPDLSPIESLWGKFECLTGAVDTLNVLVGKLRATESRTCESQTNLEKAEEAWRELAGETCPLCGGTIAG